MKTIKGLTRRVSKVIPKERFIIDQSPNFPDYLRILPVDGTGSRRTKQTSFGIRLTAALKAAFPKDAGLIHTYCGHILKRVVLIACFLYISFPAEACSRDEALLTSETQIKLEQLREAANAEGIDFRVICTYRTQAEQDALWEKGRSSGTLTVTNTRSSNHTRGRAFDIATVVEGRISWEPRDYTRLGIIGRGLGLTWGGDWRMRDYGHFEL